jgi:hypothetical protein
MNDVSIAYTIHQIFGFVCSLATLTLLCRQWYVLYQERKNGGANRSRYAVVRVQVAAASVDGNNTNYTTGDDGQVASTNGTRNGRDTATDDARSSNSNNNEGNTQVLIRRWCCVAAVIQIVAFVDPYGVRGIYPLCMWRFTHNLITSDLHCLGLGVYFITSQVHNITLANATLHGACMGSTAISLCLDGIGNLPTIKQ